MRRPKSPSSLASLGSLLFTVGILLGSAPVTAHAAALDFVDVHREGEDGAQGLSGVFAVAVSPDGRNVYAVAPSDAVAVFARDAATGALTEVQVLKDGVGNVDGLAYACAIAISPDGAFVYVAGAGDNAVASFSRDSATGKLTFLEAQKEGTAGVEGIRFARALAISPDGEFLYAAGQKSDAIAAFKRNTLTGWLTFVEAQRQSVLGVEGIIEPLALTVSPDGGQLYVASSGQTAVTVFTRDRATGHLTFVPPAPDADLGVIGIGAVALSPDGAFAYVTRQDDDAIAIFRRNRTTGALTLTDVVAQGVDGVDGLYGVFWVTVSPDGRRLYAASTLDHAVAAFARDSETGALTFIEKRLGAPNRECLAFARSVAVSPDGKSVYVAAASSSAVVSYRAGVPDTVTE
jgi:6-phosphogluconolactonase (cycloisomerase 2 family)